MDTQALDASIPSGVREVCASLAKAGYRAWVVGGCVRDRLLGRDVSDWDIASSAEPGEVRKVFRKVIPTGVQHGTVTVVHRGEAYEVTTLRGEGAYSDGRRPDEVFFVKSIEEDLARRDFTVNALAFDLDARVIVDPHGGLADLEARSLRAVGAPTERFAEDGLRILRGARFVATLEFELEEQTEAAFAPTLDVYAKVSPERVRDEWIKTMRAREPSRAFEVMERTGILARTCPALVALRGVSVPGSERDAWTVSMRAMDQADGAVPRLAALLHDVARVDDSKDPVDAWLRAYRFSNDERKVITHLIAMQELPEPDASEPDIRRFVQRVGRESVDAVLDLARVIALARGGDASSVASLRTRVAEQSAHPMSIGELPIKGADIVERLGKPGRAVGEILRTLLDEVIEDPSRATRDSLLARADALARAHTG